MYLSKMQNVFAQNVEWMCPNSEMYFPKVWNVFVQIAKCICPKCRMGKEVSIAPLAPRDLFQTAILTPISSCLCCCDYCQRGTKNKLGINLFLQITKCICPNHKVYLSKFRNIFVRRPFLAWYCLAAAAVRVGQRTDLE